MRSQSYVLRMGTRYRSSGRRKPSERVVDPYGLVRADLASVAAAVVRRYPGSNMRLD